MSDTLVANELLAFLQQKLDVMDEVSAIQICTTNFSEEDIAAAKLLLFRSVNRVDQMVSRRRDGTKKSVQDIITLLKEIDPDDVPTFVARDLHKLPPVTFDHVDVTSLLKDIVSLKASLADVRKELDASQSTVADLRKQVNELRNSVVISGSPARSDNINTRRGAAGIDTSVTSFASAVLSQVSPAECASRVECAPLSPAPAPAAPLRAACTTRPPASVVTKSTPAASHAQPVPIKATDRAEDEGFTTVQRRKRRQPSQKNRCGQAPARPEVNIRAAAPNTPVYISRLHYTTKAEDIVEYLRQKLKYTLRVQLLESRRNVYFKAFVVRVPTFLLPSVLEESFWPLNVVFRRFRGQVPPVCTKT